MESVEEKLDFASVYAKYVLDGVPPASRWLVKHGPGQSEQITAHVEQMRRQLPPAR